MDNTAREHAFEPFFTTKDRGSGTGLGLATVYGIVSRSGGLLHLYSEPGMGTTINVLLPATETATPAPSPSVRDGHATGTETILLVEDDTELRTVTERILHNAGYRLLSAHNGPAAIELARAHPGEIDLLLTDVVMPELLGSDLAIQLHGEDPTLRVLFMSGYAPTLLLAGGTLPFGAPLIDKPFSAALLTARVRDVLESPPPPSNPDAMC
jgi:CheY-like chemotaxis protein